MKSRRSISLAIVVVMHVLAAVAPAQSASVSIAVDRARLEVGDSTVLTVQVQGSQDAAAPQLAVDGFRAQYVGPSTQMSFVNGQMSSSVSHRFQLIAQKPGSYTLGPVEIDVGGTKLRSNQVSVQVQPRGEGSKASAGAPGLRLELRLGKQRPYVGERVPLTVRLLIPNGTRVDEMHFPEIEGQGLSVGKMPQPAQRDEHIGGHQYRVLYLETHVSALRAGAGELRAKMDLSVLQRRQRRRGSVFDMLGGFSERRPVEVRSDPVSYEARALPAEGRPTGFAGAVGNFDLRVSAAPQELNAGDPITVRVVVQGDGELAKATPPRLHASDQLRAYDPVPLKNLGKGKRGIEQVVIPQSTSVQELPALELSFFDPQKEEYRSVRRGPIRLRVKAGADAQSAVVAQGASGRAEKAPGPLGRDIVYIKSTPGRWVDVGSTAVGSLWFWLVNCVPVVAFGLLWWRNHQENLLSANPKLRRYRMAGPQAVAALAGNPSLDVMARAVTDYLSAKLDLPVGAVDGERAARRLREVGFDSGLSDDVRSFFADVERQRYAPSSDGDGERAAMARRARRIIDAAEDRQDLSEHMARALLWLLAFSGVVFAATLSGPLRADVASDVGPAAAFFAGNHAYAEGRYEEALENYGEARARGSESGALSFNTGNAFFKVGDQARALASYLRAQRLLPNDPDVAANRSFAEESLEIAEERDSLWRRVLFFIAYRTTESGLATAFTITWWCFWTVLALGIVRLAWQPLAWTVARIAGVLCAVIAVNLMYRAQALELWNEAVVTAGTGAVVRFEPQADGTEHFEALAGTRLHIEGQSEGWLRVTRGDGRKGWVEESAVARLR